MRLSRTLSVFVLSLLLFSSCRSKPDSRYASTADLENEAHRIHDSVITIDTHDDIPENFATDEVDPGVRGDRKVDLPKMREGGLDVAFFVVFVGQTARTADNYAKAKADAMVKFNAIHRMAEDMYPDQIEIAYTADDVERIHSQGRLVAAIGIENGYAIGKDLSLLSHYQELGARYMTLAHMGHNDIADSSMPNEDLGDPEEEHGGLSAFGEDVVREMNRVGIMVDVSHISKKAMLDAVRVSKAPVIGSHSSVRAIRDHPRNMDDEQLLALKENGGVIQIVAFTGYLKTDPQEKTDAVDSLRTTMGIVDYASYEGLTDEQEEEYKARLDEIDQKWPGATVQDFVDHIDYAVDLIGIDHVGISSDFDGGGGITGWNDASESFNVTLELVKRGYTEDEIRALWGGNTLRIWREAERVSREWDDNS